jgi:diguanylate cyclase (GGDEF)-like protein/PAS domain S-box-containing protein
MDPLVAVGIVAAAAVVLVLVIRQLMGARSVREQNESNRFASDIIDNAGEGIVVYDRDLRYVLWNRFMEELTGLAERDVVGRPATEFFPQTADPPAAEMLSRALRGETLQSPDFYYSVAETERKGWASASYRPYTDTQGDIVGVVSVIRDITERKRVEQEIEYQAYHDALTGLANRRLFHEHLSLAVALAQRRQTLVAVLFLDLDHFKLVNDSLGHSVGDALLRQVAERLKSALRDGDTVARVGGDEFTVVLQEIARREDAALVAEKVLRTIAEPAEVSGHRLYVTTSIGITVYPDDGEDAETLLKHADTAMYRAKSEGRNTYQMATRELSASTHERMAVENGLHHALEAGEFELLYQPQIDSETMQITGMEALLRWKHPQRGLILPESFIRVAEERGLILPIGEWVLRRACQEARRLQDLGHPHFRVAVNISARQFRDPLLLAAVESALAESGLQPQSLELEITETVAMEDVDLTLTTLAQLRSLGVAIAIDDFGTGHSSLAYLKRFPLDALKIDRSFVADLPDKFEDAAIVSSVIQLANGLGLRVVAEGVERREQLDFLLEAGCREVQGYYFSYPVRTVDIEVLLGSGGPTIAARQQAV